MRYSHTYKKLLLLLALSSCGLLSCSAPKNEEDPRTQLIQDTWNNFFSPKLKKLQSTAQTLKEKAHGYCASPATATLKDVQDAYLDTFKALKQQEVFSFGPYREPFLKNPRFQLDSWPVDPKQIKEYLKYGRSNPKMFTAENLNEQASSVEGLPAIQYMIYGFKPAAPATELNQDKAACQYLMGMTDAAKIVSDKLYDSWDINNPRGRFYEMVHIPNTRFQDLRRPLSDLVNAMWHSIIDIRLLRLGKPIKIKSGMISSAPGKVEARFAGKGVLATQEILDSVYELYMGAPGQKITFSSFVSSVNPTLDKQIKKAFADSKAALSTLKDPLNQHVGTPAERQNIKKVIDTLEHLQNLISTSMLQELDLVYFLNESDND